MTSSAAFVIAVPAATKQLKVGNGESDIRVTSRKERMPFPETTAELISAGYKFDNGANCRGCGNRVVHHTRGKKMPFDVDADGNCEPHWATCPNVKDFRK